MTAEQYAGRVGPIHLDDDLRAEYDEMYDACTVRRTVDEDLDRFSALILHAKDRYLAVGTPLGIPWWWIASIHYRESSLSFTRHLHNGDPLTVRTIHVPAGRPLNGTPPFTWEFSADDALRSEGLDHWSDWTVSGALFAAEKYNGLGYRRRGLVSPYLWSGATCYTKGKFDRDGHFNPDLVDQEIGCAVIWKLLDSRGLVEDWY